MRDNNLGCKIAELVALTGREDCMFATCWRGWENELPQPF